VELLALLGAVHCGLLAAALEPLWLALADGEVLQHAAPGGPGARDPGKVDGHLGHLVVRHLAAQLLGGSDGDVAEAVIYPFMLRASFLLTLFAEFLVMITELDALLGCTRHI